MVLLPRPASRLAKMLLRPYHSTVSCHHHRRGTHTAVALTPSRTQHKSNRQRLGWVQSSNLATQAAKPPHSQKDLRNGHKPEFGN